MNKAKFFFLGTIFGVLLIVFVNTVYLSVSGYTGVDSILNMSGENQVRGADIQKKVAEIYEYLDKYYYWEYDKQLTEEDMIYGLFMGIDDNYTRYLGNVEAYTTFQNESEGQYCGIGVEVMIDNDDNKVEIAVVRENSPGGKAGLLKGDKIIKVHDFDVTGDNLNEAISMIRGEPGTSVNITFYREDTNEIFTLDIVREMIDYITVTSKMLDDNIGYLRIWEFDGVTVQQYKEAFNSLMSSGMKAMILDLRNNPGGRLDTVVAIADEIVPKGIVMYQEYKDGSRSYEHSTDGQIEIPLVLLVNDNSASASEVLAGAIRDYGLGELVGMTTFGKGIVQQTIGLSDGSAINVTVSKYFTPNGNEIHGIGLKPDYEVLMDAETSMNISNLTLEQDNQLQKAIEVIKGKMK